MERDARRMRGTKPFVFTICIGDGIPIIARITIRKGFGKRRSTSCSGSHQSAV
jgi:hypothetical protein